MMGLVLISCFAQKSPEISNVVEKERAYYTRNGGFYCARLTYTKCGVTLDKCASGMVYECVTDFSYNDDRN